jgi:hypothetical protein
VQILLSLAHIGALLYQLRRKSQGQLLGQLQIPKLEVVGQILAGETA